MITFFCIFLILEWFEVTSISIYIYFYINYIIERIKNKNIDIEIEEVISYEIDINRTFTDEEESLIESLRGKPTILNIKKLLDIRKRFDVKYTLSEITLKEFYKWYDDIKLKEFYIWFNKKYNK